MTATWQSGRVLLSIILQATVRPRSCLTRRELALAPPARHFTAPGPKLAGTGFSVSLQPDLDGLHLPIKLDNPGNPSGTRKTKPQDTKHGNHRSTKPKLVRPGNSITRPARPARTTLDNDNITSFPSKEEVKEPKTTNDGGVPTSTAVKLDVTTLQDVQQVIRTVSHTLHETGKLSKPSSREPLEFSAPEQSILSAEATESWAPMTCADPGTAPTASAPEPASTVRDVDALSRKKKTIDASRIRQRERLLEQELKLRKRVLEIRQKEEAAKPPQRARIHRKAERKEKELHDLQRRILAKSFPSKIISTLREKPGTTRARELTVSPKLKERKEPTASTTVPEPGSMHKEPLQTQTDVRKKPGTTRARESRETPNLKKDMELTVSTTAPESGSTRKEPWQIQKDALKRKFGEEAWNPRKKLSPDALDGIRVLHEQYPDKFSTPALAKEFKISADAIRRILKSKWRPDPEKMVQRRERWAKRHDSIWDQQAEIGLRPPRRKSKVLKDLSEPTEHANRADLLLRETRYTT